ncbi:MULTISPECIES: hypothetical protein [unclassified Paenibacillus]|uniref:hypothetical protein n=1 Tax=unclassified Paenibacillus TaxID=185978 RepID=UPI003119C630
MGAGSGYAEKLRTPEFLFSGFRLLGLLAGLQRTYLLVDQLNHRLLLGIASSVLSFVRRGHYCKITSLESAEQQTLVEGAAFQEDALVRVLTRLLEDALVSADDDARRYAGE